MVPSSGYFLGELIKLQLDCFEFIGDRVEFSPEVGDFVQRVRALVCHAARYRKSRLPDHEHRPRGDGRLMQRTGIASP
jgi:hypothetical protein